MHVEVNGTRLWFDVDGPALVPDGPKMRERPTVVLLHGGPGGFDHSYFKPDFARLTRVAQVVYVDLRGHGRSAWGDPAEWNFDVCGDDVRAFCDALGFERPIVLGHSMPIALAYGTRHPGHPGALVFQSTYARFDLVRVVEEFRRIGGDEEAEIAGRVYGDDGPVTADEWARCWKLFGSWVPGEQEEARISVNREVNKVGMELTRSVDFRDQLSRIECPTLVSVGDQDPITPVAAAQEIFDALPDGIAQLEVIEGVGHFPWRDDPDRYWPQLEDFVVSAAIPG